MGSPVGAEAAMADDEVEEERVSQEEEIVNEEDYEVEEEVGLEGEEGEVDEGGGPTTTGAAEGATAGSDINVNSFEELRLSEEVITSAQEAWRIFINAAAS